MIQIHKLIVGPALIAAGLLLAAFSTPVVETSVEKILHGFAGGSDGANPSGALVKLKGNYYGTTQGGGGSSNCGGGCGTVYKMANGQTSVLYAFKSGSDGYNPEAVISNGDGNLYGTT